MKLFAIKFSLNIKNIFNVSRIFKDKNNNEWYYWNTKSKEITLNNQKNAGFASDYDREMARQRFERRLNNMEVDLAKLQKDIVKLAELAKAKYE